jgi:hypothetical protein
VPVHRQRKYPNKLAKLIPLKNWKKTQKQLGVFVCLAKRISHVVCLSVMTRIVTLGVVSVALFELYSAQKTEEKEVFSLFV